MVCTWPPVLAITAAPSRDADSVGTCGGQARVTFQGPDLPTPTLRGSDVEDASAVHACCREWDRRSLVLAASVPASAQPTGARRAVVSVSSSGKQGNGGSGTLGAAVSWTGRFASFTSAATNLVRGPQSEFSDAFVHDRKTGETTLSVAPTTVARPSTVASPGRSAAMDGSSCSRHRA
jgi:hypothetical protein